MEDQGMQIIEKYFSHRLTPHQREQFAMLGDVYADWNARINVVSRKDFHNFYTNHVLHSLAIAEVCGFDDGARICDAGTGGGFPAVPLAIMFPQARFTAVDSIGKKITVVNAVAEAVGLENLKAVNGRVENVPGRFDYVVSRAVTEMKTLMNWTWGKIEKGHKGTLANGIIVLKGGELAEELAMAGRRFTVFSIKDFFSEEFFETKKVIYLAK